MIEQNDSIELGIEPRVRKEYSSLKIERTVADEVRRLAKANDVTITTLISIMIERAKEYQHLKAEVELDKKD